MKKIIVILKWFAITIPLGLFAIITAPIMFPIYDWTNWKWLWIYGDSNRIQPDGTFEEDYRIFLIQRNGGVLKETFKDRYQWMALRNKMWNLRVWLEDKQIGDGTGIKEIEYVTSQLILNNQVVIDGGQYVQSAGLKYLAAPGQNPWFAWTGIIIDFRYSIIGKSMIWFKQDGYYSFRFSYCKLWFNKWITLKISCVKSDTVLTFKIQNNNI